MERKGLFILVAFILMLSCGEQPKEEEAVKEKLELSVIEMVTNPMEYENKNVTFEGVIGHICRHSGDKMRVLQKDDSDYSILVMLKDFTDKFDTRFEGEYISAQGTLKTEMRDLGQQNEDEEHDHQEGDHSCETTKEAIKRMNELGINPEIRTFIELQSFEIK